MKRWFLYLAWRNLWRNPRRTLIAMAAVALGYVMLITLASLLEGMRQQMVENGTSLSLSHLQVHAPSYYPDRSIYESLGGPEGTDVQALRATITADPRVHAAAPRVLSDGLISYGEHSAGVEILGVLPDQESRVTTLHTHIVQGSYLTEQVPKGIVMGDKLATNIGAAVGSEVVLIAQAVDGSLGNDLYTVVGIFHAGLATVDRGLVLLALSAAQDFLVLTPGRIHEIAIALSDLTEATGVARDLEMRLGQTLPVQVQAWPELAPDLADYVRLHRSTTFILFFIVFLLAAIGVMNTMLMAVLERRRELGMLMALGMRPVQVVSLIMVEAAGLVGTSLLLGGGLATPLLWYLQVYGLDLRGFMQQVSIMGAVLEPIWYGRPDLLAYGQAAVGLAVVAVVAALYPALRAAHCRVVEEMVQQV